MARRNTRTSWTSQLVTSLRNHHEKYSDLSISKRNRSFAQKYNTTFHAAQKAYYKYIVNNYQSVRSISNFTASNAALSTRFNVTEAPSNDITMNELIAAIRFAKQNGYNLVG